MFSRLVQHIMELLHGEGSLTLRRDETPPSAVFHVLLDGYEYVISIQPTKAATLNDAGEPDPPTGDEP